MARGRLFGFWRRAATWDANGRREAAAGRTASPGSDAARKSCTRSRLERRARVPRSNYCREACSCSGPTCLLLPLNDVTREEILLHHKKIRSLQTKNLPQPSGLALLEYDMELEDISSCWASRCEDTVSDCFRTPRFSTVSQTVGQIILEEDDLPDAEQWTQIMNTWLVILEELPMEMLYVVGENNLSEHNLAQILSDKILFVGCAWSISNGWVFFVCSYGPKGPSPGEEIYKVGEHCSTCPEGYKCFADEPLERLCKSEKTFENDNIEERSSSYSRHKPKFFRMRSPRAEKQVATKKKRRDGLQIVIGTSVFIVLFLFFALFGAYSFIMSRIYTESFY